MTGPASKRPRRSEEQCLSCAKKKHLYLALYERKCGGFVGLGIHKLDADNMEQEEAEEDHLPLPEPVVRFAAPERAPMAVTAVGTSIFIATSPHLSGPGANQEAPAPPTLVYDTETAALTIGPRLPDGYHDGDSGVPAAVGGDRLYALTNVYDDELRRHTVSLRVLSRTLTASTFFGSEPTMAWSWDGDAPQAPPPPPSVGRPLMTSYAVHPDGRTIFMSGSAPGRFTWSFDTGNGVWKELGCWSLPFTGQAYFDGDLDAWVGLRHGNEDGYQVCCCRIPSRRASASAAATRQPPECKMLKEKLFHSSSDDEDYSIRRRYKATLTYMCDSRFCLVENVVDSPDSLDGTLHVTLFGLRYDHNGELCTRVRRTARSYAVSMNNRLFPHAAFWM